MNLLEDDVVTVAEFIKLRLIRLRKCVIVHVSERGTVTATEAAKPGRNWPAGTLVGLYTPGCRLADIADDLACRLTELRGAA